jgi:FkbM family methyltransferase
MSHTAQMLIVLSGIPGVAAQGCPGCPSVAQGVAKLVQDITCTQYWARISSGDSAEHEDIDLLPLLLHLMGGKPGRYLEIGGAWGYAGSQTLLFEKCFGWKGVLVEAHPHAFSRMQKSGRNAHMVHAAACTEGRTVHVPAMLRNNRTGVNAVVELTTTDQNTALRASKRYILSGETLAVPCRELRNVLREAGLDGLDYISVDVQGAELEVLKTLDLSNIKVVMVEAEKSAGLEKAKKVGERGLHLCRVTNQT